jgi:SAM-dependent methyltransferase
VSDPRSFEHVAELYERVRPEYPPDAVAWLIGQLGIDTRSTLLDLGAGTGKLTRALVPYARRVIAVDPGPKMLAQLRRAAPEAEALLGEAESIPLAKSSVDAVVCGQSFHWFRHDEALPEIHRVLRSGGGVALLWNSRDQSDPVQRAISELIRPLARGRPVAPDSSRRLDECRLFGPVEKREFRFVHDLDADGVAGRVLSISFVASAPVETRAEVERRAREIVAEHRGSVRFPYVTSVYVSRAA